MVCCKQSPEEPQSFINIWWCRNWVNSTSSEQCWNKRCYPDKLYSISLTENLQQYIDSIKKTIETPYPLLNYSDVLIIDDVQVSVRHNKFKHKMCFSNILLSHQNKTSDLDDKAPKERFTKCFSRFKWDYRRIHQRYVQRVSIWKIYCIRWQISKIIESMLHAI
jgi:hypothetical protein